MNGGFNITPVFDKNFKYTKGRERITWEKNAFPLGKYFIPMIQSIPWKSYSFTGETTFTEKLSDDTDDYKITLQTIHASTKEFLPYCYFGGCVYEILDTIVPSNIRKFIDPTGDIDVLLSMPSIDSFSADNDPYIHTKLVDGTETMSELLEHYTRWIYDQFLQRLRAFEQTPLFEKMFFNTIEFPLDSDDEGVFADLRTSVGKLWFVRCPLLDLGMVKLQLVAKFDTMESSEHIIEFVLSVVSIKEKDSTGVKVHKIRENHQRVTQIVSSLPIQSFARLLLENYEALKSREDFYGSNSQHKFYNHVGRFQYLNTVIPKFYFVDFPKKIVENLAQYKKQIQQLFPVVFAKSLVKYLIDKRSKHTLWKFDYSQKPNEEFDDLRFLQGFFGNLLAMMFYMKDGKPFCYDYVLGANCLPLLQTLYSPSEFSQLVGKEITELKKGGATKKQRARNRQSRRALS